MRRYGYRRFTGSNRFQECAKVQHAGVIKGTRELAKAAGVAVIDDAEEVELSSAAAAPVSNVEDVVANNTDTKQADEIPDFMTNNMPDISEMAKAAEKQDEEDFEEVETADKTE